MPAKKKLAKKKALKRKPAKKQATKKKAIKKAPLKKKPVSRKKPSKAVKKPKEVGTLIGSVTHYFPHVQAAVIKLKAPLSVGDTIKIKGHTTDFKQTITSMQIDRVPIQTAKKGAEIGLLVQSRVRQHDKVYK